MYMVLSKTTPPKKWKAVFFDEMNKKIKTIKFGASGYEDFTQHHDKER